MRIFRGFRHAALAPASALTIGNFDGVHLGHQAMLDWLQAEAMARGLVTTALTFEPHPKDYFTRRAGRPDMAPARVSTLRDKLSALMACGVQQVVILPFDQSVATLSAATFIEDVLVKGLRARYVLVGDDFRFGADRQGDDVALKEAGQRLGFEVGCMPSHEVLGERVSSSLLRQALQAGQMQRVATMLGRPYTVSGHVIHGQKLGRTLDCPTLNVRFGHDRPATMGIFVCRVHGLADSPLEAVSSLGVRPTVEEAGRVLLEVHCLQWPAHLGREGGYGKIVQVELLHKLRDEARYEGLEQLQAAIHQDIADARAFFQAQQAHRSATS